MIFEMKTTQPPRPPIHRHRSAPCAGLDGLEGAISALFPHNLGRMCGGVRVDPREHAEGRPCTGCGSYDWGPDYSHDHYPHMCDLLDSSSVFRLALVQRGDAQRRSMALARDWPWTERPTSDLCGGGR